MTLTKKEEVASGITMSGKRKRQSRSSGKGCKTPEDLLATQTAQPDKEAEDSENNDGQEA